MKSNWKNKLEALFIGPSLSMTWILVIKLLIAGLSWTDCAGFAIVLIARNFSYAFTRKYPVEPDLFHEMSLVQLQVDQLSKKNDQLIKEQEALQSDVTGLKFGQMHKR